MKRFEYTICYPDRSWNAATVDIDKLNEYGRKGWEAVGVLNNEKILLKREIHDKQF